jgi:hypothetical protein
MRLPFPLAPEQALESLHLRRREIAELARVEAPEFQKTDPDPAELFDQPAEVFEHHADLLVAPFK